MPSFIILGDVWQILGRGAFLPPIRKAFVWNYNYLYLLDLKKFSISLHLQIPAKQTTGAKPLYLAAT